MGIDASLRRDLYAPVVDDLGSACAASRWIVEIENRFEDRLLGSREHFGDSPEADSSTDC